MDDAILTIVSFQTHKFSTSHPFCLHSTHLHIFVQFTLYTSMCKCINDTLLRLGVDLSCGYLHNCYKHNTGGYCQFWLYHWIVKTEIKNPFSPPLLYCVGLTCILCINVYIYRTSLYWTKNASLMQHSAEFQWAVQS